MTLMCPKCAAHGRVSTDLEPTGKLQQQAIRGRNYPRAELHCGVCGFRFMSPRPEAVDAAIAAGAQLVVIDTPGERDRVMPAPQPVRHEQMTVSVAALARSTVIRDGKLRRLGEDA